jgi:hypothetical protein
MNSPQKEVATDREQLIELLDILLDAYLPCTEPSLSDRELSSSELQLNLMAHSGVEFPLQDINTEMKARGYKLKASTAMELEWMMVKK